MWLFKFCVRLEKQSSFVVEGCYIWCWKEQCTSLLMLFQASWSMRLWCSAADLLQSELHNRQHHLRQLLREDIKGLVRHTYAQKHLTIQGELTRDLNPNPNQIMCYWPTGRALWHFLSCLLTTGPVSAQESGSYVWGRFGRKTEMNWLSMASPSFLTVFNCK